jgi:hypothetical protein
MLELFNPAGLEMLEDPRAAIAFGFVAPRVFYARFVGNLSEQLGARYVAELAGCVAQVPSLAYFADATALEHYDPAARTSFARLVKREREKLASIVILTRPSRVTAATRVFVASLGEPTELLTDHQDFEQALTPYVPLPRPSMPDSAEVWDVHAQRRAG